MNISVAHLLGTFQAFGVLISILNGFTFFSELRLAVASRPSSIAEWVKVSSVCFH